MKNKLLVQKLVDVCNIDYGTRIVRSRNIAGKYFVYGGGGKTFTTNEYNREDCTIVSRFAMSKKCVRKVSGRFFLNDSGLSVSTKNKDILHQDFLDLFLYKSQDLIYDLGRGQAQRNLYIDGFKDLEISLPTLSEQKETAKIINHKIHVLSMIRDCHSESIYDTEKILSQRLYQIFENGKKGGWQSKKIGEVSHLMTGTTPNTSNKEYYGGTVKWLVSGDIHNKEIFDCKKRITDIGVKSANIKSIPKNSLLIALNGQGKTKGTVAILRVEATCNQSLVAIIPKDDVKVEYLYYCLFFQYKKIRSMAGDDSRKGLNMKIIKNIDFLLPTLKEQEKIVKQLDNLVDKIKLLKIIQQSQLADFKSLENAYLREAFNVC